MAAFGASHHTGFNLLLSKSVPHILEKIFFSLDYKSFNACREVCSTWKELLASDKYQKAYELYDEVLAEKVEKEKKLLDASTEGKVEIVKQLLSQEVDPNFSKWSMKAMKDKIRWKSAPLHMAIEKGHTDVVKILLDGGADPNKRTGTRPPLVLAVYKAHVANSEPSEVIELLLHAGADPNEPDTETGNTPLFLAAIYCYKDSIKVLLAGGADANRVNKFGHTPLNKVLWNSFHWCINMKGAGPDKQGLAEVVKLLIDAGSEPHEDFWNNADYLKLFAQM